MKNYLYLLIIIYICTGCKVVKSAWTTITGGEEEKTDTNTNVDNTGEVISEVASTGGGLGWPLFVVFCLCIVTFVLWYKKRTK